jgi:hypothetical protein
MDGALMIKKGDQTIINTSAPASTIYDEIFTVMSGTHQEQGALVILILFSITSITNY